MLYICIIGSMQQISRLDGVNSEIFIEANQFERTKDVEIPYTRKKTLTYAAAAQPGGLKNWKHAAPPGFLTQPPEGYGVYTDFLTFSSMLNICYKSNVYFNKLSLCIYV